MHTKAFTHRRFYTQTLLNTDAFKHRRFYTQTLLHTQTRLQSFTHRRFYTQEIAICFSFGRFNLISCERVAIGQEKLQFHVSFWRSNLVSCERVATGPLGIAILLQFLAIEPHFVRKGCDGTPWNRNFTSVFGDRTSFRAKGLRRDPLESQFYFSFWRYGFLSQFEPRAMRISSLAGKWACCEKLDSYAGAIFIFSM